MSSDALTNPTKQQMVLRALRAFAEQRRREAQAGNFYDEGPSFSDLFARQAAEADLLAEEIALTQSALLP